MYKKICFTVMVNMVNMKKVMRCEKDLICRYKLAVELGYKDEVDAIRQSEAGALVRDSCQ